MALDDKWKQEIHRIWKYNFSFTWFVIFSGNITINARDKGFTISHFHDTNEKFLCILLVLDNMSSMFKKEISNNFIHWFSEKTPNVSETLGLATSLEICIWKYIPMYMGKLEFKCSYTLKL